MAFMPMYHRMSLTYRAVSVSQAFFFTLFVSVLLNFDTNVSLLSSTPSTIVHISSLEKLIFFLCFTAFMFSNVRLEKITNGT